MVFTPTMPLKIVAPFSLQISKDASLNCANCSTASSIVAAEVARNKSLAWMARRHVSPMDLDGPHPLLHVSKNHETLP